MTRREHATVANTTREKFAYNQTRKRLTDGRPVLGLTNHSGM